MIDRAVATRCWPIRIVWLLSLAVSAPACMTQSLALAQSSAASAADSHARASVRGERATLERATLELAEMAERKQWKQLQKCLDERSVTVAEVNTVQADGMSALLWSVWHDDTPTVGKLLEAGADPRGTNAFGVSALRMACINGNAKIAQLLIARDADCNETSRDGETMLMTACRTGNAEIVAQLLQQKVQIDAQERRGQTALMWAAAEGHATVVKQLIDAGADFRSATDSGFTPLLFSARQGHIAVAKTLVNAGADINEALKRAKGGSGKSPRIGTSPLIMAVENGHFELAVELLRLGADPNDERSGFTALHTLSWVRKPNRGDGDDGDPAPIGSGSTTSLQLVRALKESGANVNFQLSKGGSGKGQLSRKGATPLLLAAHADDLPFVKLLIELGADPTIPNADGCTALMAAAGIGVLAPGEEAGTEEEALATVEYLLSLGLSVNTVDENGETAMHGAAYKSLPKMVELLQARGANRELWNKKNKYGWTPMDIALGHRPGNFKPNEAVQRALRIALGE